MKLKFIYLVCYAISLSNVLNAQIPKDASLFQGHYYKIFSGNNTTWTEAKKHCARLQGNLAVIKSAPENHFITSKLVNVKTGNSGAAYIGGYAKNAINLKWFWVDGQSITFYKNFVGRGNACEKFTYGDQSRIVLLGNGHPRIPIETNSSRYKNWITANETGESRCYNNYSGNVFNGTKRYWVCEWDPRRLK